MIRDVTFIWPLAHSNIKFQPAAASFRKALRKRQNLHLTLLPELGIFEREHNVNKVSTGPDLYRLPICPACVKSVLSLFPTWTFPRCSAVFP